MIKAKKSYLFRFIFHMYNTNWLLRRSFNSVRLKGKFPSQATASLILVNHSSWWDGLVSFYLSQTQLTQDSYAMMGEPGLKRFPFFRKIGAFSIQTNSKSSLINSLHYAVSLLKQEKAIWMFPQGKEQHTELRPLRFQSGAAYLLEKVPEVLIIPVTYYYTFLHEQKPELFIEIGKPFQLTLKKRSIMTAELEQIITQQLDKQRDEIKLERLDHYRFLINGQRSISDFIDSQQ